jgi:hypothetical protein
LKIDVACGETVRRSSMPKSKSFALSCIERYVLPYVILTVLGVT